ncbi:hypothetical protein V8E53_003797 [Lactarius tabidus]
MASNSPEDRAGSGAASMGTMSPGVAAAAAFIWQIMGQHCSQGDRWISFLFTPSIQIPLLCVVVTCTE